MDTTVQEFTIVSSSMEPDAAQTSASAVSWGAILAGAAGAAALSLILLLLGTGLGLSAVSPWVNDGVSATTFGVSTIAWITFTHLAASGMGGYLAGRLRTRWLSVDTDEVYFRDTAHGFLTWAVASLATAALLTSVVSAIIGGGVQAGAAVVGGVANASAIGGAAMADTESPTMSNGDGTDYFIDSLFRIDAAPAPVTGTDSMGPLERRRGAKEMSPASTAEMKRIVMNSVMTEEQLPANDLRYLSQVVADRTGLSRQDALVRVRNTYSRLQTSLRTAEAEAKAAADTAREASAYSALWLFISLLGGAFIASWMATFGGRQRDA